MKEGLETRRDIRQEWQKEYKKLEERLEGTDLILGKGIGIKVADRRGINAIYALRLEVVNSSTSAKYIIDSLYL